MPRQIKGLNLKSENLNGIIIGGVSVTVTPDKATTLQYLGLSAPPYFKKTFL